MSVAAVRRPGPFATAGVLRTVDHKDIGVLYVLLGLAFLVIGGLEALLLRVQLSSSGLRVLDPSTYDQLFTMHGITMIFLVAIPLLVGFANYVVPLQIGAADVAFPRLNALSFWLTLFGGVLLYLSFVAGGAPDAGWFAYAPLTEPAHSIGSGMDWYVFGLLVSGAGTIIGAINLAVTIMRMRCPGMVMGRLPLFSWMVLVTSFLIIAAYPILTSGLVMLLVDRQLGGRFFDPAGGGNALLWQHLFWSFGHPEVYIVVLPAFGMISEIVPVFSGKPLFGYRYVAGSGIAIAFLSFSVWAHHMFAVGLGDAENAFFSLTSMLIAVPTGVKVLNWLATMWRGHIRLAMPMVFALGFIATFVIGGLTGVSLAVVPLDLYATDSYYVVGHLHYVLFGGTLMAVLAGLYYWFPKVTGRLLGRRLGLAHFWLTLTGLTLAFLPMHLLGIEGMPRRVWTYPPGLGWDLPNQVATGGSFLIAAGAIVLAANVARSLRSGAVAGDDPWDGYTLEWATASPPPAYNFAHEQTVRGKRPLWDRRHPDRMDPDDSAGRPGLRRAERTPPALRLPLGGGPAIAQGMLLFIASESIFFLAVVVAYVVFRSEGLAIAKAQIDVGRTALFSLLLFASSGTLAVAARRRSRPWLLLTAALGAGFLAGQGVEYLRLLDAGIRPGTALFGTTFFTLTGLHGLHVLVGLVLLGALFAAAGRRAGRVSMVAWEAISWYWHFVDAVWVVVFSVVYLGTAIG